MGHLMAVIRAGGQGSGLSIAWACLFLCKARLVASLPGGDMTCACIVV